MKIDCPECGGGVGVLSIREGRANCPSCGHEFDAEEHLPRPSSRRARRGGRASIAPPDEPDRASSEHEEAPAPPPPVAEEPEPEKPAGPPEPGPPEPGPPEPGPGEQELPEAPAQEGPARQQTTRREPVSEVAPPGTSATAATQNIPPPEASEPAAAPRPSPSAPKPSESSRRFNVIDELKRLGPYEGIREVARGGMGVVYKARDRHLKRTVAIKVLRRDTDDTEELGRFRREAEAAARLQHSNIVPIHAVGEVLGRPFFVMDFIEGRVLSDLVRAGELSPRSALDIAEQVAEALQYAHGQGVIHRDLKPQNIIIDRLGRPQVMDFGLAKQLDEDQTLTRAGTTMGTPAYMPPEQAEGDTSGIDSRSDVYSIGAVLYEMLTGTPPFTGSSTMNILMKVLEEEPTPPREVNPRIHRDIETICQKAMSKEKSRRYATAGALVEDIRRFRAGEAISAAPSTFLYRMRRWASKNKAAVAAIVVLVAALYGLTGLVVWQAARERQGQLREEGRRLRRTLRGAEKAISRAAHLRDLRDGGWRDRARERLDAAVSDAEYVLRCLPGDERAEALARRARKMRRAIRIDELLGHARYFLEEHQYLAAETFYKIVLEDYDPDNAEAARGLELARGVGKLSLVTEPAGVEATLLVSSERKPGEAGLQAAAGRIALGETPVEGAQVPTGLYQLVLYSKRVGRHEIPVEIARSLETDLGKIHLPEEGSAGDGMVFVPEGLVELPGGRRTWIGAFLIDRYESGAGLGEVPREGVSWLEAAAACRGRGKRLCSVSEWRRACSGPGGLAFPYGATFDPLRCWTGMTAGPGPAGGRAGCVSPFGVYDMSGNVAEWVGLGEREATTYGGDWSMRRGALLGCGSDFYRPPRDRAPHAGFRCCREVKRKAE